MVNRLILITTTILLFCVVDAFLENIVPRFAYRYQHNARRYLRSYLSGDKCSSVPADYANEIHKYLTTNTCGQDMAIQMFTRQLKRRNKDTTEPLLLIWQGDTGVGKTFASQQLKNYMSVYNLGGLDGDKVNKESVENILDRCYYPVILIEDVDRESHNVIRLLDYFLATEKGKKAGKNVVFILTMNLGEKEVIEYIESSPEVYDAFHRHRFTRGSVHQRVLRSKLKRYLTMLAHSNTQTPSGASFQSLSLLRDYVSEYIPWLPITSREIDCCINRYLYPRSNEKTFRDLNSLAGELEIETVSLVNPSSFPAQVRPFLDLNFQTITRPDSGADSQNSIDISISGCRPVDRSLDSLFIDALDRLKDRLPSHSLNQPHHLTLGFEKVSVPGLSIREDVLVFRQNYRPDKIDL